MIRSALFTRALGLQCRRMDMMRELHCGPIKAGLSRPPGYLDSNTAGVTHTEMAARRFSDPDLLALKKIK